MNVNSFRKHMNRSLYTEHFNEVLFRCEILEDLEAGVLDIFGNNMLIGTTDYCRVHITLSYMFSTKVPVRMGRPCSTD